MSAESRSGKLGAPRGLKKPEEMLIERLLHQAGLGEEPRPRLASLAVQEMSDGGMGSLYVRSSSEASNRRFGRRIAELQFLDSDGVIILASLNVDTAGDLYELDVWKTDFSPVISLIGWAN